jgi:YesN/AraC family two-component response regulator
MDKLKALEDYAKNTTLLFVEDDQDFTQHFTQLLSTFFTNITTAANGKIALDLYKKHSYDLVISDIIMPEMNGIELCRAIKEINHEQIIIISSAHDDTRYLFELINLGIDAFLSNLCKQKHFL